MLDYCRWFRVDIYDINLALYLSVLRQELVQKVEEEFGNSTTNIVIIHEPSFGFFKKKTISLLCYDP